jgi:uncharacterized protein (DUF1697 family)
MVRYVAFLRGINVSGQKIIKMEELQKAFSNSGFDQVKTYIQSGNVLFNEQEQNKNGLLYRIENLLEENFGFRTDVILRRQSEIEAVLNTLYKLQTEFHINKKLYITFVNENYTQPVSIPMFSKNRDVEIIYHHERDFVSVSHLYKGTYGFPNAFIEKLTGMPATTRNPNTLQKILEF